MILIGSRALMFRAPHLLSRKPLDFDFIASQEEMLGWLDSQSIKKFKTENGKIIVGEANDANPDSIKIECDIRQSDSDKMLFQLMEKDPVTLKTEFGWVPNFHLLFTLKASHRYLKNSPHFWKTVKDYHTMKTAGAKILPEYQEFFKLREKETYNYKHPKLNVSKMNFFKDDNIQYEVEHDDIHEAVKHLDKPAYVYYLKDGAEVDSDREKFFACPRQTQLYGVVEEAAVLAIERSLLPHPGGMTPKQAWMFALSKVCSSITSGYFREFAYENLPEIVKMYPENYWEKFQTARTEGKVRSKVN